MKIQHYLTLIIGLLLLPLAISAQSKLIDSNRFSEYTYVYQLNKESLQELFIKDDSIQDKHLDNYVTKYKWDASIPKLPRGNYMLVRTSHDQIIFSSHVVDSLSYNFLNSSNSALLLTNNMGKEVNNANISLNKKSLKYDAKTRAYPIPIGTRSQILEIEHTGVYHYLNINKEYPQARHYRYRANIFKNSWWKTKQFWHTVKEWFSGDSYDYNLEYKHTGYMVFSKSKYKPGETVKLKSFVSSQKGVPMNKEVKVRLQAYTSVRNIDTVLTTLQPYRPGAYNYEFKIDDGLKLILDQIYSVRLENKKGEIYLQGRFKYEDYELKKVNFSTRTNKSAYQKDEPVKVYIKATDENGMATFDGQVNMVVVAKENMDQKAKLVFMPDTLWTHQVKLNDTGEKEVILPNSIFPEDVSFDYTITSTHLNADNEKRESRLNIYHNASDYKLNFATISKGIEINELKNGVPTTEQAKLNAFSARGDLISKQTVTLPYQLLFTNNSDINYYSVQTNHSSSTYSLNNYNGCPFDYSFYRDNDTIRLKVNNPLEFPIWYTIWKGKKVIEQGCKTQIEFAKKDTSEDNFNVTLAYSLGGKIREDKGSILYEDKIINIAVNTPKMVYPGQETKIELSLSDFRGKPIENADVTAYAYTSKFEESAPSVPYFGKERIDTRKINYIHSNPKDIQALSKNLNWRRWNKELGLDSIEYYKFLYPNPIYKHTMPVQGNITQIAPYVVIDGQVQCIHALWLNNELYYLQQANESQAYSIPVTPGLYKLTIRLRDRKIEVKGISPNPGQKTVISIDGKESNMDAGIHVAKYKPKQVGKFENDEIVSIGKYMITVEDNFEEKSLKLDNNPRMKRLTYIESAERNAIFNLTPSHYQAYPIPSHIKSNNNQLIGPFPKADLIQMYADSTMINSFKMEGGYHYTISLGYLKLKSWKSNLIDSYLTNRKRTLAFDEYALTKEDLRDLQIRKVNAHIRNIPIQKEDALSVYDKLFPIDTKYACKLSLRLGEYADNQRPLNPLFFIFMDDSLHTKQIFKGIDRSFTGLPKKVRMLTIFDDYTYHQELLDLQEGGMNYLSINSITAQPFDEISKWAMVVAERDILKHSAKILLPSQRYITTKYTEPPLFNYRANTRISATGMPGAITGIIYDDTHVPLIGAEVRIKGSTIGAITDMDGQFTINDVPRSTTIIVRYIGFSSQEINCHSGDRLSVVMAENQVLLDEAIIIGYGTSKKRQNIPGAAYRLSGSAAGVSVAKDYFTRNSNSFAYQDQSTIRIRGASTISHETPLIILDGLPYSGDLSSISPESIASTSILKGEEATRLYGSQARNGVLIITTQKGQPTDEYVATDSSIRHNFHDDAFWQPKLQTDKEGKVSFDITYPDDITTWRANFLAMGKKKMSGQANLSIRSFKAVNAQLTLPRFAIEGDSLNVIGKLSNYLNDTILVKQDISINGKETSKKVQFSTSFIDTIPAIATAKDSLTIRYAMTKKDGYFDGEERKIPVLKQGVEETHGVFQVINADSLQSYNFDATLGTVTLYAETSSFDIFLREIEKVKFYPYLCNEQMASKMKVLFAKKQMLELFGKPFKEEKLINELIKRLNKNKNKDNLWGWWNNRENTTYWISQQVVEAMLTAEKLGYKTDFNKSAVANILVADLKPITATDKYASVYKENSIRKLLLLKSLDAKVDYQYYFNNLDEVEEKSLDDKLRTMYAKQTVGIDINIDSLMSHTQTTIMGGLYWQDKAKKNNPSLYYRYSPYNNNVQHTLQAYRILKSIGGHEKELEQIRNYMFELRKSGSWSNTYESAQIIETIMPDMLHKGEVYKEASLNINGKVVDKFPYTTTFEPQMVNVQKEGTPPIFFTAYQKAWNKTPEAQSKGFAVKTYFTNNRDTISYLQAGKAIALKVEIDVESDAEYAMIEIPIPAGCSYDSKPVSSFWNSNIHREHFKDKVSIFCTKLTKGKHHYTIDLIPRFTGLYHLNPAKAELMYFPTFYGREDMKTIEIK